MRRVLFMPSIRRSTTPGGGGGGGAPSYISALSPYATLALTSVSNGNPHWRDAAASAWRADPDLTATIPGMTTNHIQGLSEFCGGIGDATHKKLYVHGGGHQDGAYNGIIGFDFNGTSQATGWTEESGSASLTSAVTNATDAYSDGKPSAIHSYDQMWIDEANSKFYRTGGFRASNAGDSTAGTWSFALGSGSWTRLTDDPIALTSGNAAYDVTTNKAYTVRSNDISRFYNVGANTWGSDVDDNTLQNGIGAIEIGSGYDPTRSRIIVSGKTSGGTPISCYGTINWSTEHVTWSTLTPSGDSCPDLTDKGTSFCYDSTLDCFWVFGGKDTSNASGMTTIYRMEAGTFAITAHTLSSTIPVNVTSSFLGLFRRYCYLGSWRAIGLVTTETEPCYIIRLPSS